MRWRIAALATIAVLILAVVVVLARSGPVPGGRATPTPTAKATYTLPLATATPIHTSVPTIRLTPTPSLPTPTSRPTVLGGSPTPLPTATQKPPATVPPTPSPTPLGTVQPMVDFDLTFQLGGSGFTRTVDASLTNTGTIEAHNVKATLQVWSGNSRIRVNGQDMVVVELGNMPPGASVSRTITISVGFFDGLKLQTNGGTMVVDVVCDEGGKQFRFII